MTTEKIKGRRPWATDKTHTAVRLDSDEVKMLKALSRRLKLSQNAVLALALRELHGERFSRKAA